MYKPGASCSPFMKKEGIQRSTLDASSWSDPTTNIKKSAPKPVTTGFDSFFEGVSGLGKRINEAGGWKAYFQGKKAKKAAAKAGMTVDEYEAQSEETASDNGRASMEEAGIKLGGDVSQEGHLDKAGGLIEKETYDPASGSSPEARDEYTNNPEGDVETDDAESGAAETDVITEQIGATNNPPPPPPPPPVDDGEALRIWDEEGRRGITGGISAAYAAYNKTK